MSRSLPPAALAVALAVAASGCTKAKSGGAVARLRQPSSVATFQGVTIANASAVRPYLAIANASRNDVSIVDATTNAPVMAPIALRPVVLPIENRPSLLAAASLGEETPRPDLLVAVVGGGSVLQVIETWDIANTVHADPDEPVTAPLLPLAVDLGHDVLGLVPLPPDPAAKGVARIAALLADRLVAVVTYERGTDPAQPDAIVRTAAPVVRTNGPLPFEPAAMAVMPDDPATPGLQANLYFATRDVLAPGDPNVVPPKPIYGVAQLAWNGLDAIPQVINAGAPTRLVAAARLRERTDTSASSGTDAFAPDTVARVYAVLDETACGPDKAIDCGVVTLDAGAAAAPDPGAIPVAIPADYSGLQRYRAPMRVVGRPLQIAVSGPPAVPLDAVSGEPGYPAGFMRIFMGVIPRATTAVAAVASDDGAVYFLDLGRFETELTGSMIAAATGAAPAATKYGFPPQLDPMAPVPAVEAGRRLWLQDGAGFVPDTDADRKLRAVATTPGFTPPTSWEVRWEGTLPQLSLVASEVATDQATSQLALAMQVADRSGGGAPVLSHVMKLWHPALGVQKGDIVVIKSGGMPAGCVGTLPLATPGTPLQQAREPEFEVRIGALLPPSDDRNGHGDAQPGGAVTLVRPDDAHPEWQACYDVLAASAAGTSVVSGLRASIRAGGLLLQAGGLGYLGRPTRGVDYAVEYPGVAKEDELVTACPVADWDGSEQVAGSPVLSCNDACRTSCDQLVVARKARRLLNMSVTCDTDPASAAACQGFWSAITPTTTGPALALRVDVERDPSSNPAIATSAGPYRDMVLTLQTTSASTASAAKVSGTAPYEASAAIPFDRTPWADAGDGYRFYVSYPADFVLETTPFLAGPHTNVIR